MEPTAKQMKALEQLMVAGQKMEVGHARVNMHWLMAIGKALDAGVTFQMLGDRMGISRQAAHKRFGNLKGLDQATGTLSTDTLTKEKHGKTEIETSRSGKAKQAGKKAR